MRLALALSAPALLALAAAAAPTGCLPGDTRPEPASILLTVETSAASRDGVKTADGWEITFERGLVSIGDAALDGDACNAYANARYERVFSAPTTGAQKLSLVYGLGQCSLRLRLRSPSSDALLGEGASARDLAALREPGTDAWSAKVAGTSGGKGGPMSGFSGQGGVNGTALRVVGHARKGGIEKRFAWSFRGNVTLKDCGSAAEDGGVTTSLDLHGGDVREIPVTLAPEELFRLREGAEGLAFEPFAAADANDDGTVTLDELAAVVAPAAADADAGPGEMNDAGKASGHDAGGKDGGAHDGGGQHAAGGKDAGGASAAAAGAWTAGAGATTLGDLVYLTLAPRTVLVKGATCQVDRQRRGGG